MPEAMMRDSYFGEDVGQPKGQDRSEYVKFYKNEVSGKVHCRIEFAGDKQTIWDQPVRDQDMRNYWQQWQAYEQGLDQHAHQTLLENWNSIDPGSVELYQQMRIHTVEGLANLTDQNLSNFWSGDRALAIRHREMAQQYLEEKQRTAGFDKAIEAAEESNAVARQALDENAELREQLAELQKRLDAEPTGEMAVIKEVSLQATASEFPRHVDGRGRGAIYELSDGRRVKGKIAANHAQSLID